MAGEDAIWLDVLPSMRGFAPALAKGAGEAAKTEGKKFGMQFGKIALAGTAAIATGAVLAGKALYSIGEVFDDVEDTIRVGTGATGKALDGLVESAKKVGTTVPAEFEDIGQTVADVNTRLGLTGPILEKVSSQFLELGRITGEKIDIQSATKALSGFGIEGEAVSGALDHLYQVSQASGVSIGDLTKQLGTSGAVVKQLGLSFEEATVLIGSLDKAGLNSNQVMAALSRSMMTLAKDGEKPADAFKRVTGEMESLLKQGKESQAIDLAGKMFGTRGAPQLIAALKSGKISFSDLQKMAGQTGDTILEAGEDTADFAESWTLFKNRVLVALAPLAEKVFGAMGDGMDWLGKVAGPALAQIESALKGLWAESGDAPGWMARLQEAGKVVVDTLWPALQGLGGQLQGFGKKALPIVQELGARFVDTMIKNGPTIQAALRGVGSAIGYLGGLLEGLWKAVGPAVLATLGSVWETLVTIFGGAVKVVEGLFQALDSLVKGDWDGFLQGLGKMFQGVWQMIAGIFTNIWRQIDVWLAPIQKPLQDFGTWIGVSIVRPIRDMGDKLKRGWDVLVAGGKWLLGALGSVFGLLRLAIVMPIEAAKKGLGIAWDFITKRIFQPAWSWISGVFITGWNRLSGWLSGPINTAKNAIGAAWNFITQSIFQPAWNWVSGTFRAAWGLLSGWLSGPVNTGKSAIDTALGGIKGAFETSVKAIGKVWDGLKGAIKAPVSWAIEAINKLIRAFNQVARGLGITNLPSEIADPFKAGRQLGGPGAARGGILPGFTPVSAGDDLLYPMRSGEGVYVSEAMRDPYERWRLHEINRRALAGQSLQDMQHGLAGGGLVPDPGSGSVRSVQPVPGRWTTYAGHRGIDFPVGMGTPIHSWRIGRVRNIIPMHPSWGNYVQVDHGGGLWSAYAHLSRIASRLGQVLAAGQILGYVGSTGNALDVETPVLTDNRGWVRHGDLAVGDVVYDEGGSPVNVTHVAHWEDRPTYRITFTDGSVIDADENHLWAVHDFKERRRGNGGLVVRTTKEIADTHVYGVTKEYKRYAVPVAGGIERDEKCYRIDPYALGVWLGDGHAANARVTVGREDLQDMQENLLAVGETFNVSPDNSGNWRLTLIGAGVPDGEYNTKTGTNQHPNAFSVRLKGLGLIGHKRIPREYMEGSYSQRLALLQGLLDTDGYVDGRQGTIEFIQAGKHGDLARDVWELALSLGFKATFRTGHASLRGKRTGTKYRVCFTTDVTVFRMPRKAKAQAVVAGTRSDLARERITRRGIASVERVANRNTNCITVDGASHLYLAGESLIPTHNSTGPHLHWEIWRNGTRVNPAAYLAGSQLSSKALGSAPAPNADLLGGLTATLTRILSGKVPGGGVVASIVGALPRVLMSGLVDKAKSVFSFDDGGVLNPGYTLAFNGTGRPEPVLTGRQWESIATRGIAPEDIRAALDGMRVDLDNGRLWFDRHASARERQAGLAVRTA